MRAYEFITEVKLQGHASKLDQQVNAALPGAYVQKDLRNTDPYMQYRYGVAVAAARAEANGDVEFDQETPWAENLTQVMYTPEDEETIRLASKLMGVKPTKIADTASHEVASTGTQSPVAQPRRNRWGV